MGESSHCAAHRSAAFHAGLRSSPSVAWILHRTPTMAPGSIRLRLPGIDCVSTTPGWAVGENAVFFPNSSDGWVVGHSYPAIPEARPVRSTGGGVEEPGCNGVQHSVYPLRGLDSDLPPSGELVTLNGTEILQFREGKIVEHWRGPHGMHGIGLSPARGVEGWTEGSRNEC